MTAASGGFLGFDGRWVVVTGASSGLGRACAMELSAHGARTLLIGRNAERLTEVLESLSGNGHQSLVLDLTQLDQIGPEVTRAIGGLGRVYGLCHAAGVVTTRPLATNTSDVVQEMMTVNVLAGLELARIVARRDLMEPDGGSLLFVSSIYGNVGVAGQTAYSASKGAITAAVRSMAVELARRRVRVNTISPGLVKTAMTERALETLSHQQVTAIEERHPLGPGTPSDVARAAVFLLAPATTWITGIDLVVDGGYSAQ